MQDQSQPCSDAESRPPVPPVLARQGWDGEASPNSTHHFWGADELAWIQTHYPALRGSLQVIWHSPRPFSALVRVRHAKGDWIIKRLDARVRQVQDLQAEQQFRRHLAQQGICVVLSESVAGLGGQICALERVTPRNQWVYEVQALACGIDKYADRHCWQTPDGTDDVYELGVALAGLHRAASGFVAPARPPKYLLQGVTLLAEPNAQVAWQQFVAGFPALRSYLAMRPLAELVAVLDAYKKWHARVYPLLKTLPQHWVHNDAHVSNLTWNQSRPVSWLDFGGCNLGWAISDLAIALERNTITWLEPSPQFLPDMAVALLRGYQSLRPLSAAERTVLPGVLVLCQLEFALSEIAYFLDMTGDSAAADLAWQGFVAGHLAWFDKPAGHGCLGRLQEFLQKEYVSWTT